MELNKHLFSLYASNFWALSDRVNQAKRIIDLDLHHRMIKVLRMQEGEHVVLFDDCYYGLVEVMQTSKREILVQVLELAKIAHPAQEIIFFLPLLKKDALQEAVYSLAELGVTRVQLVVTEKSRKNLLHDKEFEKLESIIIAAAEQSKNYARPKLFRPQALSDAIKNISNIRSYNLLFDVGGKSVISDLATIHGAEVCNIFIGPEAGLTSDESMLLKQDGTCVEYRLTSTTLRAVQAVVLAAGAVLIR